MKHYLGKNVSIVCVLENFPDDGVVPAAEMPGSEVPGKALMVE